MATHTDTREKILDTAATLLQQHGFNGFSYKDISEPLGIRNAAVHYHFPAKGDLGISLIERDRDLLRDKTADFMARGGDARVQLEGFFKFILYEFDGGSPICPIGATAVDFDTLPPEMQRACRLLQRETLAWMTRVMTLGREQGAMRFEGDAEDRALVVLTAVQGARQTARSGGRKLLVKIFDAIRRDLGMKGAE